MSCGGTATSAAESSAFRSHWGTSRRLLAMEIPLGCVKRWFVVDMLDG